MGSDRALAISGLDGAAPLRLGKISEKYGTPVGANLFSGVVSTITLVAARFMGEGDLGKDFGVVLNIAISTTLLSYLAIFPALWRLRVTHPDHPRPYRAPWAPLLSIWLTFWVAFASIQIIGPGFGLDWFDGEFTPAGWSPEERYVYLSVEFVPLLLFVLTGVAFWVMGAKTRGHTRGAGQSHHSPDASGEKP